MVAGGGLRDLGVHSPPPLTSTSLCRLGFVPSGQLPNEGGNMARAAQSYRKDSSPVPSPGGKALAKGVGWVMSPSWTNHF